ncbi:hypothetical protein HYU17_00585 [Candidatus Woesearchaeota archaeon]|nr:hypothetical protein [Candidatus Woesearchaeota archaeon]
MNEALNVKGRKGAITPTVIFSAAGWVIAAMIVAFVILPIGGRMFGLTVGGTTANAYSVDRGFADMMSKIDMLGTQIEDENGNMVTANNLPHSFSVDKGLFLMSFNRNQKINNGAESPPECNGQSCLCVCIDEGCLKIDAEHNRGRDCKLFYEYSAITAVNVMDDTPNDNQLYVRGLKTLSVRLGKAGAELRITGA